MGFEPKKPGEGTAPDDVLLGTRPDEGRILISPSRNFRWSVTYPWIIRRHALFIALSIASIAAAVLRGEPHFLVFAAGFAIRPVAELVEASAAPGVVKRVVRRSSRPARIVFFAFCIVCFLREMNRMR